MFAFENILAFALASILIIIMPGPATFFVIGKAHSKAGEAAMATLGIVCGDIVLISVAGLGLAPLIVQFPTMLLMLKLGGAFYLAWLGIMRMQAQPAAGNGKDAQVRSPGKRVQAFSGGILITLTNPKSILFFSVFFPMFIKADGAAVMQRFYELGACFEVFNLMYFSLLILLVARLQRLALRSGMRFVKLKTVSGLGLLCCSGMILMSALP